MRMTAAITLLTALVTGGFIMRNQNKIGVLRSENQALLTKAAAQGVPIGPDGTPVRFRSRIRVDRTDEAKWIADEMITATTSQSYPDAAKLALVDRVLALDAKQLRAIIDDLRHRPDIDESQRKQFLRYLISRLSDDFPKDALEILADVAANQPKLLDWTGIESIRVKAINAWAAADPEKAWAWFQEHKDSMGERQTRVLWSLLKGVAKTHPADAIEKAGKAGLPPKNLAAILTWPDQSVDEKVAAYSAIRDWSRRSGSESSDILQQTVRELALSKSHDREIRFDTVTGWFRQAGVTPDEVGFLADPSLADLSFYIDPLETGRWMDWLRESFPEDQLKRRFQQLLNDHRTGTAAKQWLSEQPEEVADRLLDRAR